MLRTISINSYLLPIDPITRDKAENFTYSNYIEMHLMLPSKNIEYYNHFIKS